MTNGSLMKVKSIAECSFWSILQYFWPALSDNWSWKPIFGLFESVCFTKVLLYTSLQLFVFCRRWLSFDYTTEQFYFTSPLKVIVMISGYCRGNLPNTPIQNIRVYCPFICAMDIQVYSKYLGLSSCHLCYGYSSIKFKNIVLPVPI